MRASAHENKIGNRIPRAQYFRVQPRVYTVAPGSNFGRTARYANGSKVLIIKWQASEQEKQQDDAAQGGAARHREKESERGKIGERESEMRARARDVPVARRRGERMERLCRSLVCGGQKYTRQSPPFAMRVLARRRARAYTPAESERGSESERHRNEGKIPGRAEC